MKATKRKGRVFLEMSEKEALALTEMGYFAQSLHEVWCEEESEAFGQFMANTLARANKALLPIVTSMKGGQG